MTQCMKSSITTLETGMYHKILIETSKQINWGNFFVDLMMKISLACF